MNLKEIAEKAGPIIFSHEGNYGSVIKTITGPYRLGKSSGTAAGP